MNWTTWCTYSESQNLQVRFYLSVILTPILASYGIVASLTCMFSLRKQCFRVPNAMFLCALSVADSGIQFFAVAIYTLETAIDYYRYYTIYAIWTHQIPWMYFLSHTFKVAAVYITIAASFERYISVTKPPGIIERYCGGRIQHMWVPLIFSFSLMYTLPKYFEYQVHVNETCEGFGKYQLLPTDLMFDRLYSSVVNLYMTNLIVVIGPFALLLVLNARTAIAMTRVTGTEFGARGGSKTANVLSDAITRRMMKCRNRARKREATRILLSIALLFLICNFPDVVLTIFEHINVDFLREHARAYSLTRDLTNVLTSVNCAANPTVYLLCSKHVQVKANSFFSVRRRPMTNNAVMTVDYSALTTTRVSLRVTTPREETVRAFLTNGGGVISSEAET